MLTGELIKKYVTPLLLMMAVEIVGVTGMMFGVLPFEAALFLVGIFAFFVLFAPLKEAVFLSVFSIPLYTALPISNSFDSMASWRIIVAILFLRFLFVKLSGSDPVKLLANLLRTRLGLLLGLFFVLGVLSLLVAQAPMFGIKKLIYLANIFSLFFVIQATVRNRDDFIAVLKYILGGFLLTLTVGYAQFIAVFFVPLYSFWQWWAGHVIPVFYGADLARLLAHANTWFSYYKDAEPTLRMFSFFPDSHSFALFMVLASPILFVFFVKFNGIPPRARGGIPLGAFVFGGTAVFLLLAIIFSGTRGVWIGAVLSFLFVLIAFLILKFRFEKIFKISPKNRARFISVLSLGMISFLIFIFLFPVSSPILKFSQSRHGGKVSENALERISTSLSGEEISNKGRIQIWESTLVSIAHRPVLGVGIGNYPFILGENVSATKKGASAHSLYLDIVAEMGIFAGIILVLIFLEILWKAFKVWRDSRDPLFSAFAGFFVISFVWVMAYSVVDVVLINDKVLLLFVTLVALLYAVSKIGSLKASK